MIIFDGNAFAHTKELEIAAKVRAKKLRLKIAAILFTEDKGSQLYTRLKKAAAERVGMEYVVENFSMKDDLVTVKKKLAELNSDESITGIIIQKPAKTVWQSVTGGSAEEFQTWWGTIVMNIDEHKDVDGLHPSTLMHIKAGDWQEAGCVMPATAKAVLLILEEAHAPKGKIIILGKSDILGQPLFYELKNRGEDVEMIGSKELQTRITDGVALTDASVIISATGRPNLITGDLIKKGVVLIDVGEPKPDIDRVSIQEKAAFLTPVPGGVGPVTIVSLLENALEMWENKA